MMFLKYLKYYCLCQIKKFSAFDLWIPPLKKTSYLLYLLLLWCFLWMNILTVFIKPLKCFSALVQPLTAAAFQGLKIKLFSWILHAILWNMYIYFCAVKMNHSRKDMIVQTVTFYQIESIIYICLQNNISYVWYAFFKAIKLTEWDWENSVFLSLVECFSSYVILW